jgi:predicted MFS family arabinose efflux permease
VARVLPEGTSRDAGVLLATRSVRGFVDGAVSVALAAYLQLQGWSPTRIGVLVTAMMLGSGALTLTIGTRAGHFPRALLLRLGAVLMAITGIVFGLTAAFGVLIVMGAVGTLNPTSGDVSLFLPLEQSVLTGTAPDRQRTALFARYAFAGGTAAALGSLAVGIPDYVARTTSISRTEALRGVFVVYALVGVIVLFLYARLSPSIDDHGDDPPGPLGPSRPIVYRLAAVFSLDSFGGGFTVQALLALWLLRRFDVSLATTGQLFFWTGLISGFSAFLAVRLARRIGLIRTMAFTHLPANFALIGAAFAPNLGVAVALLVFRSLLSTMDVPARSSYVMAVVSPAERAAAASVTNVPRSVASAIPPIFAGWMLAHSTFGWPLVVGGAVKATYDLLLLGMFRHHRPPEEQPAPAVTLAGE